MRPAHGWWILLALIAWCPVVGQAQVPDEELAVVQVVEDFFTAMRTKDVGLLERSMTPTAFLIGVGGGGMSQSTRDDFAASVSGAESEWIEPWLAAVASFERWSERGRLMHGFGSHIWVGRTTCPFL